MKFNYLRSSTKLLHIMKLIKYFFFLLLIAIIGGAVYFGTQDGSFDTSVSKNIAAPASMIYDNVSDFKNWESWEPWSDEDPNMKITYPDSTEGVGGSYSWTSKVMGDGMMKTTAIVPNEKMEQQIKFDTPIGEVANDIYWVFNASENGNTEVTWGMKGERSFLEKVYGAFQSEDIDSQLKAMFGKGLTDLEIAVQAEMEKFDVDINGLKEYGGGYYMYTTAASKMDDLGAKMGPMMGKVSSFMERNKVAMAGMPFTIYNEMDELNNSVIFSTAIPIKERIIVTEGDVLCGYMDRLIAVKTTLSGNYTHLSKAYELAQNYIIANAYTVDPSKKMFEVYTNDPGTIANPAEWKTEIYIPILQPVAQ